MNTFSAASASAPAPRPIVLLVTDEYPPFTAWGGNAYQMAHLGKLLRRSNFEVEVIAESDNGEEFVHLDGVGNRVHRINADLSYGKKMLRLLAGSLADRLSFKDLLFAARVFEKASELESIWNRRFLWIEATNWRASTFFLHFVPRWNERLIVRTVTPMEQVVRENRMNRKDLGVRVSLWQELAVQALLKNRLWSNEDYPAYFKERVRTEFPFSRPPNDATYWLPFDFSRVPVVTQKRSQARTKTRVERRSPIRVLMVGRIEPRKGFDTIGEALTRLSPKERERFRIVCVGRDTDLGPFGSYREFLAQKYPLVQSCFEFLGNVSEQDFKKAFDTADVGLVASTSESFGYNLLELLASNLPVLTSRVGAAQSFERAGAKYLGTFDEAGDLCALLRQLPEALQSWRRSPPDNRTVLEEAYARNDASYLDWASRTVAEAELEVRSRPAPKKVRSVDIIVCSYNRFDELTLSLPSVLRESERSNRKGVKTTVTIVYQNAGMPELLAERRPDLAKNPLLRLVFSDRPSLTRARNIGVANTSGDVVIFVDDDVVLKENFVDGHVQAFNRIPSAVGTVGRILSRQDGGRETKSRAIGQIRASGLISTNFDSGFDLAPLAPLTPMGANMGYRRQAMNEAVGEVWFDEMLTGSAFREETTLAIRLARAGYHFAHAPHATLYHFESVTGGCQNRTEKTLAQLVNHYALDHLYLNRLYAHNELLRAVGPALQLYRDVKDHPDPVQKLRKVYVNLRGYLKARSMFVDGLREPSTRETSLVDAVQPSKES